VPLSDAADAWSAVRALFDSRAQTSTGSRADRRAHGHRRLECVRARTGVLLAGARTLYYERVLDATTRARFEDFPPSPQAEALVMELRGELTRLFMERGAAHLQIAEPIVIARDCVPNPRVSWRRSSAPSIRTAC